MSEKLIKAVEAVMLPDLNKMYLLIAQRTVTSPNVTEDAALSE